MVEVLNRRGGPGASGVLDAVSEMQAQAAFLTPRPFGVPQYVNRNTVAHYGDLLIVDTDAGDVTITLPSAAPVRPGALVAVCHVGINRALVRGTQGAQVDGLDAYPMTRSVRWALFFRRESGAWTQIGGPSDPIWLEWNGRDLNQFRAVIDGANVNAASVLAVTTLADMSAIDLQSISTAAAGDWTTTQRILPFASPPPTLRYMVEADVVPRTFYADGATNRLLAGVAVRIAAPAQTCYRLTFDSITAAALRLYVSKISGGTATTVGDPTYYDRVTSATSYVTGARISLKAESGAAASAQVSLGAETNMRWIHHDTSSPIGGPGYAGIMICSCTVAIGATTRALFRNIRVTLLRN